MEKPIEFDSVSTVPQVSVSTPPKSPLSMPKQVIDVLEVIQIFRTNFLYYIVEKTFYQGCQMTSSPYGFMTCLYNITVLSGNNRPTVTRQYFFKIDERTKIFLWKCVKCF
eukprot:UN21833